MAPEQVRGVAVDGRADVFAFGALLYELLAGRLPFDAETSGAMFVAICSKDPTPLATAVPDIAPDLARQSFIDAQIADASPSVRCRHFRGKRNPFPEGRVCPDGRSGVLQDCSMDLFVILVLVDRTARVLVAENVLTEGRRIVPSEHNHRLLPLAEEPLSQIGVFLGNRLDQLTIELHRFPLRQPQFRRS